MDASVGVIEIDGFIAFTLGIVVFFLGQRLTQIITPLRTFNIPEPVSGGLLAALVTLAVFAASGREIVFDLAARDALLVYFFTIVGLNARVSDLLSGGKPLAFLLAMTIAFMLVQNGVGMLAAVSAGLPAQAGVLLGTAAFIGGHGTAIAWGPVVAERFGVAGAAELGIAAATLGLILASLAGGPIAKRLIDRHNLGANTAHTEVFVLPDIGEPAARFDHIDVMRSLLVIHVAIIMGLAVGEALAEAGAMLPTFVPCLLAGIVLSNTLPRMSGRFAWPARSPAMAMLSDLSLSIFLAMSLMSMQLWTLASSAGLLVLAMLGQLLATTVFVLFVFFRVMGRDYFAAVLSAGFVGFALGATPTAIANMGAVTRRYGPSPLAFIVLPLVSAFFVDLANAVIIQAILSL
ncbi:MAG: sodium/glutamate symporter [Acuticoccus sp.]